MKQKRAPDIVGQKFGMLTVLQRLPNAVTKHSKFLCRCDCGRDSTTRGTFLLIGRATRCWDCGNLARTIHGDEGTVFYSRWRRMLSRCYYVKDKDYHNYGGRGITVCDEWRHSYVNFKRDMFESFSEELTMERIDVNGNYFKENCRWATRQEQGRNTRKTRRINTNKGIITVIEASELTGIKKETIINRIDGGCPSDLILYEGRFTGNQFSGKNKWIKTKK